MASTGTLKVSVFDASRQPWTGPEVRLVLTDPFTSSSNKKLVDKTMKKGINTIVLEGVPTDAGQRYILFMDADKHRSHSVFPVKPAPDTETPLNVMLIPKNPIPNFAAFTYKELKLRSPQFHSAISQNISESDFLGLARLMLNSGKYG